MQSDAFPTPPIYSHNFEPELIQLHPELPHSDCNHNYLLNEIELLMADCSSEESRSFWLSADCIKFKHQVAESMQKIEDLFLDLVTKSTQDPALISTVSQSLRYTNNYNSSR